MSHGRCPCCNRSYRSELARKRAEAYAGVHRELPGGEPFLTTPPTITYSGAAPLKQETKLAASEAFRLTGTGQNG